SGTSHRLAYSKRVQSKASGGPCRGATFCLQAWFLSSASSLPLPSQGTASGRRCRISRRRPHRRRPLSEDLAVSAPRTGRFGRRAAILPLSIAAHAGALATALLFPVL